jgi:uncharacterized protein (DUF885 family)
MRSYCLATACLIALCFVVLPGCSGPTDPPAAAVPGDAAGATAADEHARAAQRLFLARPTTATAYGMDPDDAGGYHADRLELFGPEHEAALRADLRAMAQRIEAGDSNALALAARENQQAMASVVHYYAGAEEFPIGYIDTWMGLSPFIVNQINGPLIEIPETMKSAQPIRNVRDAQDYNARLGQFGALADSVIAKLDADAAANWIPPTVVLQGAARYLEGFIASPADAHSLVGNLRDTLAALDDIDEETRAALVASAIDNVSGTVYPAYQRVLSRVEELIPRGRSEAGIWAQPNGAAFYEHAIRSLGDSARSADEIHQIGLDEVARISAEMDAILSAEGYAEGSVGARMTGLGTEARFLYDDSEAGRAELIADINRYIEEISVTMAPLFRTQPPYQVEVRAFPVEIQDGAPGGQYSPPSLDGTKPGIYWINLRDPNGNPRYSLKTLSYHEANPGHHWQVALAMAQSDLPFLRRIAPFNAYVEGWALYSEQLAAEIGMYRNDPFGDLGRLQAELFRAVRLVVDTGLHHKRWTREQAVEYMADTTGQPASDVVAEIDRYMAWPAQALGYKLGQIEILALRDGARQALGERFDLAAFHDLVLLAGALPMAVLEARVKAWIDELAQAPSA